MSEPMPDRAGNCRWLDYTLAVNSDTYMKSFINTIKEMLKTARGY